MGRKAHIISILREQGYTVEGDSILFVSLLRNHKKFEIMIYAYDLFRSHIVDDVVRRIRNLMIEDGLYQNDWIGDVDVGKTDELILVVDRRHLFEHEATVFQGIETNPDKIDRISSRLSAFYETKRSYAENDERKKQPIPYVIILRGDEVFLYERLSAGGEPRLHGQLSIGVGGHMNLLDESCRWHSNLNLNMHKELNEELTIQVPDEHWMPKPKRIGILNNDNDETGRVHLGIIHILEVPENAIITVKETDKLDGYWVRLKDISKPPLYQGLETWSQMVADILENLVYNTK